MATQAQRERRRRARARRAANKQRSQNQQNGNGGSRQSKRRGGTGAHKMAELACSFANPWCSPDGIKWPDMNAGKSVSYRERLVGTLQVNATNFVGAALFHARLKSPCYVAPSLTTNNFPVSSYGTATEWPDNPAGTPLAVKAARVVNYGVRIRYVGPALYAAGVITMCTIEGDESTEVPTSPDDYCIEKQIFTIQPGMDIIWLSKPLDSLARRFINNTSTSDLSNWSSLAVFFEGMSTETLTGLYFEVLSHFEFLPTVNGALMRAATPAAADNQALISQVSNVLRKVPSAIESAKEAIGTAAQFARFVSQFGGPAIPLITYP